jgi:UPF0716 protein FxsA
MLFLVFVVGPVVELLFAIEVAHRIGWAPILVWTLVTMMLGPVIARREGATVWRGARRALQEGRIPRGETVNGLLILIGGVLLFLPGLISDGIGLLLLAPPVRFVVRRRALRRWFPSYIGRRVVDVEVVSRDRSTTPPAQGEIDLP